MHPRFQGSEGPIRSDLKSDRPKVRIELGNRRHGDAARVAATALPAWRNLAVDALCAPSSRRCNTGRSQCIFSGWMRATMRWFKSRCFHLLRAARRGRGSCEVGESLLIIHGKAINHVLTDPVAVMHGRGTYLQVRSRAERIPASRTGMPQCGVGIPLGSKRSAAHVKGRWAFTAGPNSAWEDKRPHSPRRQVSRSMPVMELIVLMRRGRRTHALPARATVRDVCDIGMS